METPWTKVYPKSHAGLQKDSDWTVGQEEFGVGGGWCIFNKPYDGAIRLTLLKLCELIHEVYHNYLQICLC